MRRRPAEEADLQACGRIFAVSVADLVERYRPEQADQLPVDPEERRWLNRHLLATGAVFVAEDPDPVGLRSDAWYDAAVRLPRLHRTPS